jgi:ubiquinone/menaquinone biosynthesis C-methylase UbiE
MDNPKTYDTGAEDKGALLSGRLPHAVLDLPSRRLKGLKIERLLGLAGRSQPLRILEVGTGSGGIAHYFGTHESLDCEVDAVDVHDNRMITAGYRFHQVEDTRLPFPDEHFDVVLTNHVIEHVGNAQAQRAHLAEIRRVLHPAGVGYLAVPNRWMLVEPHYKLAFLSWLPHAWRTPYLRLAQRGERYDCEPLRMGQLERLLTEAKFRHHNLSIDAFRQTLEIEYPLSYISRLVSVVPDMLLLPWQRIVPTLIYRIWR